MFVAFFYGFFTALIGLVAGLIYVFAKLKESSHVALTEATDRIQRDKAKVDSASKLDPIRLTSNPRVLLGTDEPISSSSGGPTPAQSPGADCGLQWLDDMRWLHTRLMMVGTTISLYETLATSDVAEEDRGGGGAAGVRKGIITAERYIGKMSTSQLTHRALSLDEVVCMFADPLSLNTSSSRGPTTAAEATGSPGADAFFGRHGTSAVWSAAANLHRQLCSSIHAGGSKDASDSLAEKNAAQWLKEHVRDRVLFVEYVGQSHNAGASDDGSHAGSVAVDGGGGGAWRSIFLQQGNTQASSQQNRPAASSSSSPAVHRATCMVMWFPTRREMDRWANVLSATSQTFDWKQYVRTLPSLDVLNLLIARIFFENTSGHDFEHFVRDKIEAKLNAIELPSPLSGHVAVASITIGGEVPLISNVSFASFSTNGEIGFDFDVHYRGGFRVVFAASFYVKSIRVPQLLFHVHVLEVSGRVHVSIGPPPTNKFWVGFHAPPNVRLEFTQEVATHDGVLSSILSWIPDLSDTISNFVKVELFEDMLLPNLDNYTLPHLDSGGGVAAASSPAVEENSAAAGFGNPSPRSATSATLHGRNANAKHERVASSASSIMDSLWNAKGPSTTSPQHRAMASATPPPPPMTDTAFHVISSGSMKSERPAASPASSNDGSNISPSSARRGSSEFGGRDRSSTTTSSLLGVPTATSELRNRRAMEDLRAALKNKAGDVRRARESSPNGSAMAGTASSSAFQQPQWNHPSF